MKVKANYGISCDRGYFETGAVFDIGENELPKFGDAVTVVSDTGDSTVVPLWVTDGQPQCSAEGQTSIFEAPAPKPTRTRKRKPKAESVSDSGMEPV